MLPSIFEKQEICSNRAKSLLIFNIIQYYQQKKKRIMQWNVVLLFDLTLLQCYKPHYNSFKIVFDI